LKKIYAMENISYQLASSYMDELKFTDKLMVVPTVSKKKLIGFDAVLLDNEIELELSHKLHRICGDLFNVTLQKQSFNQTKVIVKAHKHIIDNGGVFYKSILSVLKDFVNEGIYFYSIHNIYSK